MQGSISDKAEIIHAAHSGYKNRIFWTDGEKALCAAFDKELASIHERIKRLESFKHEVSTHGDAA